MDSGITLEANLVSPTSPGACPLTGKGLPFFGHLGSELSLLYCDVKRAVAFGAGPLLSHALSCLAESSSWAQDVRSSQGPWLGLPDVLEVPSHPGTGKDNAECFVRPTSGLAPQ